jgi:parallel beta-helix repeat protein
MKRQYLCRTSLLGPVRRVFPFCVSLFLLWTAAARSQCYPPPTNIVSWWQAEGNATDALGLNNGSLQGGVTFTTGEVGQAFSFDGATGSVIIPDSPSLEVTNQVTLEAWINMRNTNVAQAVMTKYGGAGGNNGYQFYVARNTLTASLTSPGVQNPFQVTCPLPIVPGTWNHVAFTYNQSAMTLYFNGQPVATNVIGPTNISVSSSNFRIGANDNGKVFFNGEIDEAAIYNQALTALEIADIYSASSAGKCGAGTAPVIFTQPVSETVVIGNYASFTVSAGAFGTLSYQWLQDSMPVPGATNPVLAFPSAQPTNAGTYQVVVSNAWYSITSSNAVLTVGVPPAVTNQPQSQMAAIGSTASISVGASGSLPLSYQWLFNSTNIAGATNSVLTLTNVQPAQGGPYAVLVTNSYGSTLSSNAVLTVGPAPSISAQPTNQMVAVGLPATFSVTASGAAPVTYQWLFGGSDLPGETNSSLSVYDVNFTNAGSYSVVVTDPFASITSSNAELTVTSPDCDPPPTNLVSWWQAEGDASDSMGTNNGALTGGVTFTNGEVGQAFEFNGSSGTVIVPDSPPLEFMNQMTIEAWINTAGTNSGNPQSVVSKVGGSGGLNGYQFYLSGNLLSAQFNSPGSNWPSEVITSPIPITPGTWNHVAFTYDQSAMTLYFNGQPVATNAIGPATIAASSSRLLISGDDNNGPTWFNGAIDEVSVYNRALSASEIAVIYGAASAGKCGQAPAVVSQPQNLSIPVGSTAVFNASVLGARPLNYQWMFDSNSIPGATNCTLSFTALATNAGFYAVSITNAYGATLSSNATLSVIPLTITNQPQNVTTVVGTTATFSVGVLGTVPLSYQWLFGTNIVPGASNSSLTLTNVTFGQAGSYSVEVTNLYGTVASSNAVLTVTPPTARYVNTANSTPVAPFTNWSTAATNIQDAVDAANAGDIIVVTNGVYQYGGQAVNGFALTNRVAAFIPLTIESVNGPSATTILGNQVPGTTNGNAAVRCAYLTNGATLTGFTLTNGATLSAGDTVHQQSGGGVYCESANAVVSNCVVAGNSANSGGGGAYSGTLFSCTVTGNSVFGSGGGASTAVMNGCALNGNWASASGGGVSGGSLNNCTVTGNSASSAGGASGATLNNCIVYFNNAPSYANYDTASTLNYCCATPLPSAGTNNFPTDPQLASSSHIGVNSPCRGAGSAIYATGTDIDGDAWLNPPSIGCDEYRPGSVTGPLTVAIAATYTNLAAGGGDWLQALVTGRTTGSSWDFGDGSTATNEPYIYHVWSAPGDYQVALTAWNETYPSGITATFDIQVVAQPVFYVAQSNRSPTAPYGSWATAATNIQDAVNAATVPGSLILVTNGIYTVKLFTTPPSVVAVSIPLTLESVNGPAVTTISGSTSLYHCGCVYLTNGDVLAGFTLTGGQSRTLGGGGGVCCMSTNAVITNCVISSNSINSDYNGGGAYQGTLINCTLSNNSAFYGAGAYGSTLYNCTLIANRAGAGGGGGGAYNCTLTNCALGTNSAARGGGAEFSTLVDCILNGNTALGNNGGGVFDCSLISCLLTNNSAGLSDGGGSYGGMLTNCILAHNSAASGGGACDSTLTCCTLSSNSANGSGGGVSAIYGSCTLSNCTLTGNTASVYGGGAAAFPGFSCMLNNCTLTGNTASSDGGGAYVATLNNCMLTANSASSMAGGAYDAVMNGCILTSNSAYYGGGVCVGYLTNCILRGNTATYGGGADGYFGNCALVGCVLTRNLASYGGGVSDYVTLTNCVLTTNTAFQAGGAAYESSLYDCLLTTNFAGQFGGGASGSTLYDCTVVGNSVTLGIVGVGGGIEGSTAYNCVLYYNTAAQIPDVGNSQYYYCDTRSPGGPGNITNAPLFVSLAGGDFHLVSNSPCINAGNNSYVTTTTDLDGNQRISGGTVDIGAYEYQNPPSIISYAWLEEYGLATDGSADNADPDGDGMNNWREWIAGTNPTNAASVLKMLTVSNAVPGLSVTWESVSGITYYLQRAGNVSAQPAFTSIQSNIVGQAGTTTVTDTNATGPGPWFYRVGVQ